MMAFPDTPSDPHIKKGRCSSCGGSPWIRPDPVHIPASPVPHITVDHARLAFLKNFSPTLLEQESIANYVGHSLLPLMTELQSEVDFLDTLLRQKRHELRMLRGLAKYHKRLLRPIDRLPPELLCEIFLHISPNGTELPLFPEFPDSFDARNGPVSLTHVCRSWSLIALDTPRLWTSFRIPIGRLAHKKAQLSLTRMFLARTASLPLDVCLVDSNAMSPLPPLEQDWAVSEIISLSHRWRTFHIILSPMNSAWPLLEGVLLESLQGLEQFSLISTDTIYHPSPRSPWGRPTSYVPGPSLFQNIANLKSYSLNCPIYWDAISMPHKQLTCLKLYTQLPSYAASMNDCLEVLTLCPHLTEFHVCCNPSHPVATLLPAVRHAQLTTFCIVSLPARGPVLVHEGLGNLFERLALPSLRKLHVNFKSSGEGWDFGLFSAFLVQVGSSLEVFDFRSNSVGPEELIDYLKHLPNISHLTLDTIYAIEDQLFRQFTSFEDEDLSTNNHQLGGEPAHCSRQLLPKMKQLVLRVINPSLSAAALLTFLDSRSTTHRETLGEVACLTDVRLHADGLSSKFLRPEVRSKFDRYLRNGLSIGIFDNLSKLYPRYRDSIFM